MSLSKEKRLKNILVALAMITQLLNKQTLRAFSFHKSDATFGNHIFPTTWKELEHLKFIQAKNILAGSYRLTASGWVTSLNFLKDIGWSTIEQDLGKLSSAFKSRIKATNRNQHALAKVSEISHETGLDEAFIVNSIDARLMDTRWSIHGAEWMDDKEGSTIVIPTNFGMKRLI
jgi:hypothetical protein